MRVVIAMLALLLLFSGASAQGNLWYGGWLVVPNWTWQSPSRPIVPNSTWRSPSPCWEGRCTVPLNQVPYGSNHQARTKRNVAHPSLGRGVAGKSSQPALGL
jgi:hypothetical protein